MLSEIHYHPPSEALVNREFIELYNSSPISVDLSGWKLRGDADFDFPDGTRLEGKQFLIVAADPSLFADDNITALGPWNQPPFSPMNSAQTRSSRTFRQKQTPSSRKVPDIFNAYEIYHLESDRKLDGIDQSKKSALLEKARRTVSRGMDLRHPHAFITQSFYEFNIPGGDKHLGVELQVKSANLGGSSAMANLTKWMGGGLTENYGGKYQLLAIGNSRDYQEAGELAVSKGARSWAARLSYATKLSRSEGKDRKANHKKAANLLKDLIAEGECNAHDVLGIQRIQEHIKFKGLEREMNQGFAHLIYHSNHSSYSLYLLGLFYGDKAEVTYAPVKQAAVYRFSLSKFGGVANDSNKEASRRLPALEKGLSESQLKALKVLEDQGFPSAKRFREPAYQLLVKSGDLPKGWKFDQ